MKKGVWIVLIIAIVVAGVFAFLQYKKAPTTITNDRTPPEMLKVATFTVPESDARVTLANGEASFKVAPGSAQEGTIELIGGTTAEWKKDGKTQVSAVFAVDTGGTAIFSYLVLFDASGGAPVKKSEAFLGDRIIVTNVGIGELVHDAKADYRVTVQTLVRKDDEPFSATPEVHKTRTFYVTDGQLKEIETGSDDS